MIILDNGAQSTTQAVHRLRGLHSNGTHRFLCPMLVEHGYHRSLIASPDQCVLACHHRTNSLLVLSFRHCFRQRLYRVRAIEPLRS